MAISEGYIVYNKTIKTTYTYTTCLLNILNIDIWEYKQNGEPWDQKLSLGSNCNSCLPDCNLHCEFSQSKCPTDRLWLHKSSFID